MSEREQALAGLREFQQEAATLRTALRRYELVLGRTCRKVEQGAPLHEVMRKIGVSDLRADLVERLERFEGARHRMRVACFRMSLTEGLSIGDIARLWGISRQLASRLVNETAKDPTPRAGPTARRTPAAFAEHDHQAHGVEARSERAALNSGRVTGSAANRQRGWRRPRT